MPEKTLSDFIKKNIPDWDIDKETEFKNTEPENVLNSFLKKNISDLTEDYENKRYTFTAPLWFTDIQNLIRECNSHNKGEYKYTGFNFLNHEIHLPNYLIPIKTFDLNYKTETNLKPTPISEYKDVNNVDRYSLEQVIEASMDDLKYIYLNHIFIQIN